MRGYLSGPVVSSYFANDEDKKDALAAGMNGHIGKPIEMDALLHKVKKLLHL